MRQNVKKKDERVYRKAPNAVMNQLTDLGLNVSPPQRAVLAAFGTFAGGFAVSHYATVRCLLASQYYDYLALEYPV